MASPRQVGQSLRQVARALDKIPDDAIRDVAETVSAEATRRGGTFMQRRVRLGSKIEFPRHGAVIIRGKPAGFWAIKNSGRGVSVARGRALGSAGGSFHAKRARAAKGDKRWDRVHQFAEDESPRVFIEAVRKALR